MTKIRIVIADDHAVVRSGLSAILGAEKDLEVVGQAQNGREAVNAVMTLSPDIVIMDLRMPEMDGVSAIEEIRRRASRAKIIVLTSFGESDDVAHALEAGAHSAITKTAEDAELVSVIRMVADDQRYISPEIRKLLHDDPPVPKLTPRQQVILGYMVKGLTNKDISGILSIREDSVEDHVKLILEKINASNRTEAVAIALRKHLLKA